MSRESRKFQVPDALANIYDFANTLDLRHFTHHGVQHQQAEELADPAMLGDWMKAHGLVGRGAVASDEAFEQALRLRGAIRDYLKCDPVERHRKAAVIDPLNKALQALPLRVAAFGKEGLRLQPVQEDAQGGLSTIAAELYDGAANGTLDRLKMCAADDCQRVFYDRSKPGTRRWCQSVLCGNREKTRNYRARQKRKAES